MGNVEVAWEDVISVINMVRTHLIIIAIAFIAMIAVMIIVRKKEKLIKRMIRFQSFFAFLLITVVTLNVAAAETLYNTLNVVLSDKGTLDQGHIDNSKKVIEDVTNEGVVMTKKKAWERADGIVSFVDYVEGIYVGYRFYETAADEGLINYDDTVMYPFGYGLSYTTFDETMGELRASDDGISVDVTVTNTGDTAGKDVVELYYDPPYYNGGIEKSSVNLLAFDKTDLLEPGESETVTLTFSDEDMASYDTYGAGHYVSPEDLIVVYKNSSTKEPAYKIRLYDIDTEDTKRTTHYAEVYSPTKIEIFKSVDDGSCGATGKGKAKYIHLTPCIYMNRHTKHSYQLLYSLFHLSLLDNALSFKPKELKSDSYTAKISCKVLI